MAFSKSEKKVIRQIRKDYVRPDKIYMFWFVYDIDGQAISWEGGWDLLTDTLFRNEYSIESATNWPEGNAKPVYKTVIG